MRVALIGGTGVLGKHVLAMIVSAGWHVRLLVRSQDIVLPAHELVQRRVGDLLDADSLGPLLRVAMPRSTSPPRYGPAPARSGPDWAKNDAVRAAGTANLLLACRREGVRHLIAQSVAFVSSPTPDAWCTGTEPLAPLPILRSAVAMETQLRFAQVPCGVLRGGLFYGRGTETEAGWQRAAISGKFVLPRRPLDYVSLIHVEDMARAIVSALDARLEGCHAAVDDEPIRWLDLFAELAARYGAPDPIEGHWPSLPSFRVSNRGLKSALAWRPHFPSFREGLSGCH